MFFLGRLLILLIRFDAYLFMFISPGHISPGFLEEFGSALEHLRTVFGAPTGQPIILSGSGTLGWEVIAANLLESKDGSSDADVLVVNTGYFSDSWKDCFECFGLRVTQVKADKIGATVPTEAVVSALKANPSVRLVALTQVDTSTAVLNDIAALSKAIKSVNPDILVAVDGVCSVGGEAFEQDAWGVDAAMTCSQKALGCPPGLSVMVFSDAAIKIVESRKSRIPIYYGNLRNWLPIMRAYEQRKPSYFATPNVNLIRALNVSLKQLVGQGMKERVARHARVSTAFKAAVRALGLGEVPTSPEHSAHTLSAVLFPTGDGVDTSKLLPTMVAHGVVAAGGLHKDIKATYFRVGHMGESVMNLERGDVERVVVAIEAGLKASGYQFTDGAGVKAFQEAMKQ